MKKIIFTFALLFLIIEINAQNDESKFYKHIELRFYIGASHWIDNVNNRIEITHPIYETGVSYSFKLPNNFLLFPYIGYSSVTINNSGNSQLNNSISLESFNSLIGGSSLYYKLNSWNFGVSLYAKNILNVIHRVGIEGQSLVSGDESFFFNKIYYLAGINVLYSLTHFNIIAEARFNPTGIQSYVFHTQHINEYLIGVGFHL